VERFQTDGAIHFGSIGGASMRFQTCCLDTDSTFIAMGVGVGTADAANAALLAMILPFVLIV
jgi:hypothetical protein